MEAGEHRLGDQVSGPGLQLIMTAISPSIMPFETLETDQVFPTTMLVSLFGEDENWLVRGEQVGGLLLRHLRLVGSMNTERAVRAVTEWLLANHPGAEDVRVERADHHTAETLLRLDYPPRFLQGILQRVAWGTRGGEVRSSEGDPYRFRISY